MKQYPRIGITSGMRGMFPVMYDEEGPIMTGMTCKTQKQLRVVAISWARAEEIPCDVADEKEEGLFADSSYTS